MKYIKIILCSLIAFLMLLFCGCSVMAQRQIEEEQQEQTTAVTEDTAEDTTSGPEPEILPEPEPELQKIEWIKTSTIYTLTFAGDCTLGGMFEYRHYPGSFDEYVEGNFDYPFEYCQQYFKNDDLTIVNLEGVLSNSYAAVTKKFRLVGYPEYAQILTAGNIEVVNLANNHTYDFGMGGYADTKAALESESIEYVEDEGTLMYTTDTGLVIGFYSAQFSASESRMREGIQQLRDDGAEIIIFSYHGGVELSYRAAYSQEYYCKAAIDAGADIVFGHHPHVLQPVEEYNGGIIFYSLGNFSFGGNGNPQDHDTAIIQQKIVRDAEGNVSLGETVLIPYSITSTPGTNDYRPVELEEGTEQYNRCMEKLLGAYTGPDLLPLDFGNDEEEGEIEEEETETPEEGNKEETPPNEDGGTSDEIPTEGSGESNEENPPAEGGGGVDEIPSAEEGGACEETPPENTDG